MVYGSFTSSFINPSASSLCISSVKVGIFEVVAFKTLKPLTAQLQVGGLYTGRNDWGVRPSGKEQGWPATPRTSTNATVGSADPTPVRAGITFVKSNFPTTYPVLPTTGWDGRCKSHVDDVTVDRLVHSSPPSHDYFPLFARHVRWTCPAVALSTHLLIRVFFMVDFMTSCTTLWPSLQTPPL
jgi:hypothetical protein